MTDPYSFLGESLTAAARRRRHNGDGAPRSVRAWLARRLNAAVIAVALVLGGGAIAVAATGLLNGSPVKDPAGTPTPTSGSGVPVAAGGSQLAAITADPEGGLPWAIQLVHTTRGELCVQIGRVHDGQIGQLGIDGAFHDDGRFHPLSPDVLPEYGGGYADISCVLPGETLMGSQPTQDRNAEWMVGPRKAKPARDLRAISFGVLGPHAVSVSYRTSTGAGTRTVPVSRGTGAYMIVQPIGPVVPPIVLGGFSGGFISGDEVSGEPGPERFDMVRTVTFRFGALVCSIGSIPPGAKRCPTPPPPPQSAFGPPTRSLHLPVRVKAVAQSQAKCRAAFLLIPCYRAEVEFKAPYAITSAGSEYEVEAGSTCKNARPSGWSLNEDVARGQTVRTVSSGLFNCTSIDEFQVRYMNASRRFAGSSTGHGHESVIIGAGFIGKPARGESLPLVHPVHVVRARPRRH
ncbi:MAG TPA: hypothetical protein VK721_08180 [Solirubrobacteraceae bacterium]|jgi:hypothetical protein|nr:hypothetical protein [Solirubrobacteraceae bacterium]